MATLLEYLHAVAEDFGEFGTFTTTADATDSDYLVSSSFVNSNLPGTMLEAAAIFIEDGALAGQQAEVRSGSGVVKTTGVVNFAQNLTGNVANGVTFGAYTRMPAKRTGMRPGYIQIINRTIRRIPSEDRIPFVGVTGQKHYTITRATYPWWDDDERIIAVYHPVTNADDDPRQYTGTINWESDSETISLVFPDAPWKTGDTFTVKVYRPGNSRLKVSGVWIDQTTETAGLVNLTDEALPSVDDVIVVARAYAYRSLSKLTAPGQLVSEWLAMNADAEQSAVRLLHDRPKRDRLTGIPNMRPGRSYATRRSR